MSTHLAMILSSIRQRHMPSLATSTTKSTHMNHPSPSPLTSKVRTVLPGSLRRVRARPMAASLTTFEVKPAISTPAEVVATLLSRTEEVTAHLAMVASPTTTTMPSPTGILHITMDQLMRTHGERTVQTISKQEDDSINQLTCSKYGVACAVVL